MFGHENGRGPRHQRLEQVGYVARVGQEVPRSQLNRLAVGAQPGAAGRKYNVLNGARIMWIGLPNRAGLDGDVEEVATDVGWA